MEILSRLDPTRLSSSLLLQGDEVTAYRDPCVVFHEGVFHLFYTLVRTDVSGRPFLHLAKSVSNDLVAWTDPRILTVTDNRLNYSSPGSIVRHGGRWVMCLQTYPRPMEEKYADETARLWAMESEDLEVWDAPQLLKVKGPDVPGAKMGRMIDPYIFPDQHAHGQWWCFFKQDGVSMSRSWDLTSWTFVGRIDGGENACVVWDGADYVLFHSPENGIGIKRSRDLIHWKDAGHLRFGQDGWPWAQGRLTAGCVLDLRENPSVGKALMFFHGSGPEDERTMFDTHASIGLAWSDDLTAWEWIP